MRPTARAPGTDASALLTQFDAPRKRRSRAEAFTALDGVHVALVAFSVFLWAVSLRRIDTVSIPDVGLVGNLPMTYFAAVGLLTLSFAAVLWRNPERTWPWAIHLLPWIVMLHGTLPFVYAEPRFGWTYKHIGVTGFIQLHGTVAPIVDAYHNWPGFFAVAAFLTQALGLEDATPLARWAQPAFNLLYLLPLLLIFRSLAMDRRVVWLAAWLFFATNFLSQDYFAPQAFAYLLYLVALVVVLNWFVSEPQGFLNKASLRWIALRDPAPPPADPNLRLGLAVLAGFLFLAVAASHQLMPFALVAALVALTLTGRNSNPVLVIAALGATILWNVFMASTYFEGQTSWHDTIGRFFSNFQSLPDTLRQTEGRVFVAQAMRALVFGIWGLAILGTVRRVLAGRVPGRAVALALAPFPLVLLGSYGGEIMLRIFFYSLPFMCLLAAWAFFPVTVSRRNTAGAVAFGVAGLGLAAVFLVSYLGKEWQNRVLSQDVQIMRTLYKQAAPESMIVTVTDGCCIPFKIAGNYDRFAHVSLIDDRADRDKAFGASDLKALEDRMRRERRPAAYFVFSESLARYFAGNNILKPNNYAQLQRAALERGWRVALRNAGTVVLEKRPQGAGATR